MTYALLVCPKCGSAHVVELGSRTTSCARCRKRFETADALAIAKSESLAEVQNAYGAYNAKHDGASG